MINIYIDKQQTEEYNKYLHAFAEGIRNNGGKCTLRNIAKGYIKAEYSVVLGYKKDNKHGRMRKKIIDKHKDLMTTVIIERGYIHRDKYFAVGLGNLNGRADFKNDKSPPDRWRLLDLPYPFEVERSEGHGIVICGQVDNDASVRHIDYQEWVNKTYKTLVALTNDLVSFKPHPVRPKGINPPEGCPVEDDDLKTVLGRCRGTVCFNSNSGVESLLAGVPTIACDPGSMVYDIVHHDLQSVKTLKMPSKKSLEQWAHDIAYTQWTYEEMLEGLPQRHLGLI